jgi:hypothetical protein
MSVLNAVQIVESFRADVWVARNPEAADRYVVDDFVIMSAWGRDSVKECLQAMGTRVPQTRVAGLEFEIIESFQNAEGNGVAPRWRVRGRNNGFLGLPADQQPLEMTGTPGPLAPMASFCTTGRTVALGNVIGVSLAVEGPNGNGLHRLRRGYRNC